MSTPSVNIPVEAAPAAAAPSSLPSRLGKLFFSPGDLGEELRETAPWAGAFGLLLAAIVATQIAAFFLITDQMFVDFFKQMMVEQGATQLPPDEALMQGAKLQKGIGIVAAPIVMSFTVLFGSFVLWLMFSVVGGGKATFRNYMSAVVHALFISLAGGLLLFPLQLSTGDLDMSLSFALVADRLGGVESGGILSMILGQLEVFKLWSFAVLGILVAAANRWKGWVGPAGLIFFVYAAFAIGLQLIGKMMQPGA